MGSASATCFPSLPATGAALASCWTVETVTDAVAAKMTRDQLARADVAVLIIDAGVGPTTEDAKIAGLIEDAGRPAILVLNKKDLVPRAQSDATLQATKETFPF